MLQAIIAGLTAQLVRRDHFDTGDFGPELEALATMLADGMQSAIWFYDISALEQEAIALRVGRSVELPDQGVWEYVSEVDDFSALAAEWTEKGEALTGKICATHRLRRINVERSSQVEGVTS